MKSLLNRLVREEEGQDLIEYALLAALIALACTVAMGEVGVDRYDEYIDYLELHPEEFAQLFNTILINVTGFFRDPVTWEYLATDVLPGLLSSRADDGPIRVWSACETTMW